MSSYDPKSIRSVLKEWVTTTPLAQGIDNERIKDIWNTTMGSQVQAYTKDIKLQGNTLYVTLNSSTLRQELNYGTDKIIDMLNEALKKGLIKKLVFR